MEVILTKNEKEKPFSDHFVQVKQYHSEIHDAEIVYPEETDEIHHIVKDTNTNVKFLNKLGKA